MELDPRRQDRRADGSRSSCAPHRRRIPVPTPCPRPDTMSRSGAQATSSAHSPGSAVSPAGLRPAPPSREPNPGPAQELSVARSSCTDQYGGRRISTDVSELPGEKRNIVPLDLTIAGITTDLLDRFVDVIEAVQVALGQQSAVRVDRQRTVRAIEGAVGHHVRNAAGLSKAIALDLRQDRVGEAVVEFGEVDVGWS